MSRVLVTGATGFIGRRLVPALLAQGHEVRALARTPSKLDQAAWRDRVEVVEGDVGDSQAVFRAADRCDAAVYLVHAMSDGVSDLAEREEEQATAFADGCELGMVRRIVYLGGLVDEERAAYLSEHLYSRWRVGEVLRAGQVPVVELRAGVVIGVESASFRIFRVAADSPLALDAPWTSSRCQPIAVEDLEACLVAALDAEPGVYEIGGPDVMTYADLIETMRDELGGPEPVTVSTPYLPPEATAPAVALLSGVDESLTASLLASARHDAVARLNRTHELLGRSPLSYRDAVARAADAG